MLHIYSVYTYEELNIRDRQPSRGFHRWPRSVAAESRSQKRVELCLHAGARVSSGDTFGPPSFPQEELLSCCVVVVTPATEEGGQCGG